MKILKVVHSFIPYTMAGTEVYAYRLAKELSKKHNVSVFFRVNDCRRIEYSLSRFAFEGLTAFELNHTFRSCNSFSGTFRDTFVDQKFAEVLDEVKPDIVHLHHLLFLSHGIVEEAKKRGIPVVYTLHDYWLICYRGQLIQDDQSICEGDYNDSCKDCLKYLLAINKYSWHLYRALRNRIPDRLLRILKKINFFLQAKDSMSKLKEWKESTRDLCSKIDIFIAPSKYIKNKFIEKKFKQEKIFFSSYGLDHSRFRIVTKIKSPKLRFGFLGTLLPAKGIDILISAFKQIKDSNVELVIYGRLFSYIGFEGYTKKIKRSVSNDNRIKIKGGFDNEKIAEVLANIDVVIVPSLWLENAPLVIQEAFLAKTPVIASNIGGIPELVSDGINGFLFHPGDKKDLLRKMQYIIDNPGIIEEFKKHIPKVKSIEENAGEMEAIYINLLTRSKDEIQLIKV